MAAQQTSDSSCGIALIGQKFMGRAHSNAWGQAGRFFEPTLAPALRVIAARNQAELEAFATRWGWERWTTDWRSIAEADDVDLVDIGTPNDAHAEQAIAMLEAGKHVACEKPLARDLKEARTMAEAAEKSSARTFVWFNYRRCPAASVAYQLIREGKLGRIYHVRAHYLQSWGGPETPMSWRFSRERAGSGAHGDLNAHIVDLARFLTGEEIVEVHGAVSRTFVNERADGAGGRVTADADDCVLFLGSLSGGGVASFEATRLAAGHLNDNTIEVNGELGSVRFSFEDMNVLWLYDAADRPRTDGWRRVMCTHAGAHPYVDRWWPDGHVLGYEHGFVHMAADILRVLAGETPEVPLPDFADACRTQRVLEAALVSAAERSAVRVEDL